MKKLKNILCKQGLNQALVIGLASLLMCYAGYAEAASSTLGTIAQNITGSFAQLTKLITASSYVAGVGFAIASIFKFHAHKNNPTQITIGTPIALLFIGAALLFMPNIFGIAGETIFGSTAGMGSPTGIVPGT